MKTEKTTTETPTGDRYGIPGVAKQGSGLGEVLGAVDKAPNARIHDVVESKPKPKATKKKVSTSKKKEAPSTDSKAKAEKAEGAEAGPTGTAGTPPASTETNTGGY